MSALNNGSIGCEEDVADERSNLATAPEHAATLADLRSRVATQSAALNQRRSDFSRLLPPEPRRSAPPGKKAPASKGD